MRIGAPRKRWVLATIQNPNPYKLTLSGYGELGPHEKRDVPDDIAYRFRTAVKIIREADPARPRLSLGCYLDPNEGYGIGGIHMVRGLLSRGWDVEFTGMAHPETLREYPELNGKLTGVFDTPAKVGLVRGIPLMFPHNKSAVKVGWTMWDATRLPSNWVPLCNSLDYLVVPSIHQESIFAQSGVTVPMVPVPEPIDLDLYPAFERPKDRDTFTFVGVNRMCSRKCPIETVQCFQRAFPTERDVRLVMKTRHDQFGMGSVGIPSFNDDRITVHNENWPRHRVVELFHRADAGVFLSHGEGFYHGPVQAMATGLPVITPDHSGAALFANPKVNYPVGLHPDEPVMPTDYYVGHMRSHEPFEWWQMDYDAVVDTMRDMYRNRDKARRKGLKAAEWVRLSFGLDVTIAKLDAFLRGLA